MQRWVVRLRGPRQCAPAAREASQGLVQDCCIGAEQRWVDEEGERRRGRKRISLMSWLMGPLELFSIALRLYRG